MQRTPGFFFSLTNIVEFERKNRSVAQGDKS
jgi:hypothetical protein